MLRVDIRQDDADGLLNLITHGMTTERARSLHPILIWIKLYDLGIYHNGLGTHYTRKLANASAP